MLTSFGKALRKIRIDLGPISLREMAEGVGVSPTYLSAVETGKKELTNDFLNKILLLLGTKYPASGSFKNELIQAASETMTAVTMNNIQSQQEMEAAIMFARQFEKDGAQFAEKFKKFLEEESD